MDKLVYRFYVISILVSFYGCGQVTYQPHSAKQKYFAKPHVQFMMTVVNFREKYGVWPPSLGEMELMLPEAKKIIHDFQYQSVDFLIKDGDNLTVRFYNYKKTSYYADPSKIDLNAFQGRIRFYKSDNKFVWKVRMK